MSYDIHTLNIRVLSGPIWLRIIEATKIDQYIRYIPVGEIEPLETTVEIGQKLTAELLSTVACTTEDSDKQCPSWHEEKEQLRQMYECSVSFTLETGLSSAFYIFEVSGKPTLGKLSLQEYVAKHGYGEAVVWANENIPEKPYWLIDCVGGDFTRESDAFEEAWGSRQHYHESGGCLQAEPNTSALTALCTCCPLHR